MKSDLKKFFIKISRLKGDVASIIGLRLSFVLSFFVSLLVLTILNVSFMSDKNQIMPQTAELSNASVIVNLVKFRQILNSPNFKDDAQRDKRKHITMVEGINKQFNRQIVKYIFIVKNNEENIQEEKQKKKSQNDEFLNNEFINDNNSNEFISENNPNNNSLKDFYSENYYDRNIGVGGAEEAYIYYKDMPKGYRIELDTSNKSKIRNGGRLALRVVKEVNNEGNDKEKNKAVFYHPHPIPVSGYYVYLGFEPNYETAFELNNIMKDFSIVFIILALMMTFSVTYFVSMLILRPLERLRVVASKFAEGDLSDRVDSTYFTEINDLITSYNTMADVLQKLYSSLEAEVSARTKELKSAYIELQITQALMVHSEKMKSLGELVAGIMHEINNPINFIYGNMTHLDNYSKDLIAIIDEYSDLDKTLSEDLQKKYKSLKEELDYDFIKSDIPDLIKSCKEGAERAKNIIQDLKSFSRFEESAISNINIEKEVDTCLTILYNKYKNRITIHKEFPESMPSIEAYGGQLNQVFMNILDNAIGAIPDQGDIWIRALFTNNNVRIEIEDNGSGMSEETKQKVFNPFFTTKPVGQGTGLGMSITYKVIKNHNGDIEIETKEGIGTKFIITLPLNIDRELMIKDKKEEV